MCRTYESKNGPYTRLCSRTGQPGRHLPGRLADLPRTPSGGHVAGRGGGRRRTGGGVGPKCAECGRPLWAGSSPPFCADCIDKR